MITIPALMVAALIGPEPAGEMRTEVYYLADVLVAGTGELTPTGLARRFDRLMDLMRNSAAPGSWDEHAGTMSPSFTNCALTIRQSDRGHAEVQRFVRHLRALDEARRLPHCPLPAAIKIE